MRSLYTSLVHGVSIICAAALTVPLRADANLLRGWECVPSVIRADATETFLLKLQLESPIQAARLQNPLSSLLIDNTTFRDDGIFPDQRANDRIFTLGPIRWRTGTPPPSRYRGDTASPAGVDFLTVGEVIILESDGTESRLLIDPSIGVMTNSVPALATRSPAEGLQVSDHLVNLQSSAPQAQFALRGAGGDLTPSAASVYRHLPDLYDFMVFLSIHHQELADRNDSNNFVAGRHIPVQVNYTGTGHPLHNDSSAYGSAGRLKGIVILDSGHRGTNSLNLTHELLHQWGGRLDPSLGLSDSDGHYLARSSIGSLLGGQRWLSGVDERWTIDCPEGRNGAYRASPLDLYLMGAIDAALVPPLYVYPATAPPPLLRCGQPVQEEYATVTIEQIRQYHGPRVPGVERAQKRFRLAFVIESRDRLLNPTEMTFYETLASHITRYLPPSEPDPYVGFNWAPVSRFFAPHVTFTSSIPWSDLNDDGHVNGQDVELFNNCVTGPDVPYMNHPAPACDQLPDPARIIRADFDADGDVDQSDFGLLQPLIGR